MGAFLFLHPQALMGISKDALRMLSATPLLSVPTFPTSPGRLRGRILSWVPSLATRRRWSRKIKIKKIILEKSFNCEHLRYIPDPRVHRPPLKCFPYCSLMSCSFPASEFLKGEIFVALTFEFSASSSVHSPHVQYTLVEWISILIFVKQLSEVDFTIISDFQME